MVGNAQVKEIIICDSYFSRGNHFRREFTNLGEVTSLIPNHVHVMALTATATERTIARVSAILGLVAPKIITVSPDKSNICYWVKPRGSMKEMCEPLLHKLRHQRTAMPRVIIYCKKCDDCASIYYFFLSSLKHEFTEPISAPNVSQFRLVDMYTGVTHKDSICGTSGFFLFVPLEAVDVRMPAASSGVNGALVTMSVNSCSSLWKCSFACRYLSVELE